MDTPDSPPNTRSTWKRLAIISLFFGAGLALMAGLIVGGIVLYSSRPTPPRQWDSKALTAKYDTIEFTIGASNETSSYPVDFYYNIQNNSNTTYQLDPATLTPLAVLRDGNAMSKDFGHYQSGSATVDGPPFIPPGGTARIDIKVSYSFPDEFTSADRKNGNKIIESLGHRTNELNGFVIFDGQNHYRIDLPRGWEYSKDKAATTPDAGKDAPVCPANDPVGLFAKTPCTPLPGRR